MHDEILSESQQKLLSLVRKFSSHFGLVGGTAVALQIGHRRSIDFDLFTFDDFDADKIRETIRLEHKIEHLFIENPNELTILVDGVKMTFYKYPFPLKFSVGLKDVIHMPDLTTLAAMKAYALGRRAKWKDYVDLYFIFRTVPFETVVQKAHELFSEEFNEKLFREQLAYFKDIDYSEKVDYLAGFQVGDDEIQKVLIEASLERSIA